MKGRKMSSIYYRYISENTSIMSKAHSNHPFADLSPDAILEALESVGVDPDGRLFELNSYENRVYQAGLAAGGMCVAKFYRAGRWSDAQILEEHAFAAELVAADLSVAAPQVFAGSTLHHRDSLRFAVFPKLAGRAPELDGVDSLELLGRALGRLHAVGARSRFAHRPSLSIERLGWAARDALLRSSVVDGVVDSALIDRYAEVSEALLEKVEEAFERYGPLAKVRLHGDCHLGNILWSETGPVFVDLDDCMMGPRIQDLWMLLSGTPDDQEGQWQALMRGYRQFHHIDESERELIEPLRSLRMIHHSSWIAQRWDDPAFPRAFPWFTSGRFWQEHLSDLWQQAELL
jgi:Ser/Thr protein kinase RdoA (MazF antagonist)